MLARRSITDPTDIAYYLSNAPVDISPLTLARVASTRYTVEQSIEEGKDQTGLDEYESCHAQIRAAHLIDITVPTVSPICPPDPIVA